MQITMIIWKCSETSKKHHSQWLNVPVLPAIHVHVLALADQPQTLKEKSNGKILSFHTHL